MEQPKADHPAQGTCVGYEIRSPLTFHTLRSGGRSSDPIHIVEEGHVAPRGEVVATWPARPGNPFEGRLLQDGGRYAFWASDAGWYRVDPARKLIILSETAEPVRREVRLFGVPTAVCAFEDGDISIHASGVEVNGQAVLLAGPTKFGKTTLAGAFARAGHRLLTEDTTRCITAGAPAIFPGPAVLRLRSDVAEWLRIPGARPAGSEKDRVSLVFDERLRGSGGAVPLRAILLLRKTTDRPTLRTIPAVEAVREVFGLTFWLPTDAFRAAAFRRIADVVVSVPTFALHRPLTMDSLPEVVALVEDQLSGRAIS